jgi:hypothetical protein
VILWLSVLGVCLLTAIAVTRMLDRAQRARRDADWGDWPPDQMAQ